MSEVIFFSIEVTLMQLTGAYLRWLPFCREMSPAETKKLFKVFLIWTAINFSINITFLWSGVTVEKYRILFTCGWIPYVILSMYVIRNKIFQHFFVWGMQGLWTFMLHSVSGMIISFYFGIMTNENLLLIGSIFLSLFALLLPVERNFFTNILPSQKFFDSPTLRWYVAFFPLIIFFGTYAPIVHSTFMVSWHEKLSRLILPMFFLIMYQSLSISTRQLEEQETRRRTAQILRQQLLSMREHHLLMKQSHQEVEELRKNLSENYRVMDELLNAGKISDAMEYINAQENLLSKTFVERYCDAPLVNAALSIYLRRAQEIGVKITQKINLPENFYTDENDFAVLLSNLLENAIQASAKQKENRREISVFIQHNYNQFVMEISNRFDFPIQFGENDLPCTDQPGHGLGMTSLNAFAKKYDAYLDFSQENGVVKLSLYWEDQEREERGGGTVNLHYELED